MKQSFNRLFIKEEVRDEVNPLMCRKCLGDISIRNFKDIFDKMLVEGKKTSRWGKDLYCTYIKRQRRRTKIWKIEKH